MTDEGQKAIEAAARAAGHAEGIEWDRLAPDTQEQLTVTAMAAIRAYLAALSKPEAMTLGSGLALRPYHPSGEMRKAGEEAWREFHTLQTGGWFAIWQAMFRAYNARPPGLED